MTLLDIDRELIRDSYYEATAPSRIRKPALDTSPSCDVAIVGAGLAGLSAALELAQRGLDVVLLEAREAGYGASGRNGGQVIHGLACDMEVVESQLGRAAARQVFNLTIQAMDLLRGRIDSLGIDCEWRDGFLSVATSPRKAVQLQAWAKRMEQIYQYPLDVVCGRAARAWVDSARYHGAAHDPCSGHVHPLKLVRGLARAAEAAGVRIFEGTPVKALHPGQPARLCTPGGDVRARHVLLAGNVYLREVAPYLAARVMAVGTYIAATQPLDPGLVDTLIKGRSAVCDTNRILDYFRPSEDHRLLWGGRASYSTVTPRHLSESLRRRMVATFPQLQGVRMDYVWGGFVDVTLNRAPDFGRLPVGSGESSNVYYVQGFSGHGLALTGLAGRLVAEAIAGDAEGFDLFARIRHRPFPGGTLLRRPAFVLGRAWYRLRDAIG